MQILWWIGIWDVVSVLIVVTSSCVHSAQPSLSSTMDLTPSMWQGGASAAKTAIKDAMSQNTKEKMQQSTGHSITTTHNQVVRLHSRDRNASVCGSNYSCFWYHIIIIGEIMMISSIIWSI